jgi:hypothetical protein
MDGPAGPRQQTGGSTTKASSARKVSSSHPSTEASQASEHGRSSGLRLSACLLRPMPFPSDLQQRRCVGAERFFSSLRCVMPGGQEGHTRKRARAAGWRTSSHCRSCSLGGILTRKMLSPLRLLPRFLGRSLCPYNLGESTTGIGPARLASAGVRYP